MNPYYLTQKKSLVVWMDNVVWERQPDGTHISYCPLCDYTTSRDGKNGHDDMEDHLKDKHLWNIREIDEKPRPEMKNQTTLEGLAWEK